MISLPFGAMYSHGEGGRGWGEARGERTKTYSFELLLRLKPGAVDGADDGDGRKGPGVDDALEARAGAGGRAWCA